MLIVIISSILLLNNTISFKNTLKGLSIKILVLSLNNKELTKDTLLCYDQNNNKIKKKRNIKEPDLLIYSVHQIKNSFISKLNKKNFQNTNKFLNDEIINNYVLIFDNKIGNNEFFVFKKVNTNYEIEIDKQSLLYYFEYEYYQQFSDNRKGAQSITLLINNTFKIQLISANFKEGLTKFYNRTKLQREINKRFIWNKPNHITFYFGNLNYELDYLIPHLKKENRRNVLWYYSNVSEHANQENYNMFKYIYPMIFNYNNDNNDDNNNKEIYKEILGSYDQLMFSKSSNYGFKDYIEPEITFKPNYNVNIIDKENYNVPYYKSRILYKTASSNIDPLIKITSYNLLNNKEQLYKITPLMMDAIISVPLINNKHKNLSIYSTMRYKELKLKILLNKKEIKSINNDREISSIKMKVIKHSDEDIPKKTYYRFRIFKRNFIKTSSKEFITGSASLGLIKLSDFEFFRVTLIIIINKHITIKTEGIFTYTNYLNEQTGIKSYLKDRNGNVFGKALLTT